MTERQRVTLHGGPLDGMEWEWEQPITDDPGAYMIVPGETSRAIYEPDPPPADQTRWIYRGMIG